MLICRLVYLLFIIIIFFSLIIFIVSVFLKLGSKVGKKREEKKVHEEDRV